MGSGFRCATRSEAEPLVAIGRVVFTMAFGRDVDYHDTVTQLTWLDRRARAMSSSSTRRTKTHTRGPGGDRGEPGGTRANRRGAGALFGNPGPRSWHTPREPQAIPAFGLDRRRSAAGEALTSDISYRDKATG